MVLEANDEWLGISAHTALERHTAVWGLWFQCRAQIFLFDVITTLDDHKVYIFALSTEKNEMPFSRNYFSYVENSAES